MRFTEEWILAEARRQYDEGRALIDVDPGRTALLVVDMIDEFVKPQWCPYWVPDATRQVPAIRALIGAFHAAELPVIYTAYELGLRGLNAPAADRLIPGGELAKEFAGEILQRVSIYEPLAPAPEDLVLLKHVYGGFTGTELDLVLKSLGVTTVAICGTMSNFCCGATARQAFWHGYKVIFGSDVTSTTDPKLHEAELRTLRRGFARVMSGEEIAAAVRTLAYLTPPSRRRLLPRPPYGRTTRNPEGGVRMRLGEFTEEFILEEAQRQYTEGRALIDVDPGKTALIVVDMMDEFVKPEWCPYWVPDATRQVPKINELRATFHYAKLPVIYTAYDVSLRGLNFPITEWLVPVVTHAAEHDVEEGVLHEVKIYEELEPVGDDLLILKHCYSGFYGTELDLVLRSLGVTTIVICGTMSNFCCGATAREAFWHGYKVIFGSDVNSTDDPELHEAELRTLRRGFARIMTADEIIADVRVSAEKASVPIAASA